MAQLRREEKVAPEPLKKVIPEDEEIKPTGEVMTVQVVPSCTSPSRGC